jgi:hypothetical protein
VGRVRRRRVGCSAAPPFVLTWMVVVGFGVSVDGVVRLICAGWLPQYGAFGGNGSRV